MFIIFKFLQSLYGFVRYHEATWTFHRGLSPLLNLIFKWQLSSILWNTFSCGSGVYPTFSIVQLCLHLLLTFANFRPKKFVIFFDSFIFLQLFSFFLCNFNHALHNTVIIIEVFCKTGYGIIIWIFVMLLKCSKWLLLLLQSKTWMGISLSLVFKWNVGLSGHYNYRWPCSTIFGFYKYFTWVTGALAYRWEKCWWRRLRDMNCRRWQLSCGNGRRTPTRRWMSCFLLNIKEYVLRLMFSIRDSYRMHWVLHPIISVANFCRFSSVINFDFNLFFKFLRISKFNADFLRRTKTVFFTFR